MWTKTYSRKQYWIWVVALVLAKIGAIVLVQTNPNLSSVASSFDLGIISALAIVVGARFADVGWSRWLGVGLVILVAVVVPLIIFLLAPQRTELSTGLLYAPPEMALATVAIAALLLVAGVPRSGVPAPAARSEPTL